MSIITPDQQKCNEKPHVKMKAKSRPHHNTYARLMEDVPDKDLLTEVVLRWGNIQMSGVNVSCYANGHVIVRENGNHHKFESVQEAVEKVVSIVGETIEEKRDDLRIPKGELSD